MSAKVLQFPADRVERDTGLERLVDETPSERRGVFIAAAKVGGLHRGYAVNRAGNEIASVLFPIGVSRARVLGTLVELLDVLDPPLLRVES